MIPNSIESRLRLKTMLWYYISPFWCPFYDGNERVIGFPHVSAPKFWAWLQAPTPRCLMSLLNSTISWSGERHCVDAYRECFGAMGPHIPDVCASWSYELSFPTIIVVFWGFLQQIQAYWMLIIGGNWCYLLEISITHTRDDYTLASRIKWQKVSNTAHITSSNVFHVLHSDDFSSCFPLCTIENSLCLFNIAIVAMAHRNRCFLMIYLWKMAIFHGHVAVLGRIRNSRLRFLAQRSVQISWGSPSDWQLGGWIHNLGRYPLVI